MKADSSTELESRLQHNQSTGTINMEGGAQDKGGSESNVPLGTEVVKGCSW